MCTGNQKNYVEKLNQWKAADIDLAAVEKMTAAEASKLIADLKCRKSSRQDERKLVHTGKHEEVRRGSATGREESKAGRQVALGGSNLAVQTWNPLQATLAKRAVVADIGSGYSGAEPAKFATACLKLYEAFNRADKYIRQKYPEVRR